jgi:hypothetical protein
MPGRVQLFARTYVTQMFTIYLQHVQDSPSAGGTAVCGHVPFHQHAGTSTSGRNDQHGHASSMLRGVLAARCTLGLLMHAARCARVLAEDWLHGIGLHATRTGQPDSLDRMEFTHGEQQESPCALSAAAGV